MLTLPQSSDTLREEARVIREAADRASVQMMAVHDTVRDTKRKINSLQWAVCESEVLRDPSLPPAARKILTELADLKL